MKITGFLRDIVATVWLLVAMADCVHAQGEWPTRTVRIISTFAPGGSSDLVARQLAQHLSARYGQQFVVENRVGAAGNIGVDHVAKSARVVVREVVA